MSAAAPAAPPPPPPPPPPHHRTAVNTPSDGSQQSHATDMAGSSPDRRNAPAGGPPAPSSRPLPHIQDLVAKVERRVEDSRYASLDKMLNTAQLSLTQSRFFLSIDRLDQAYVEYLVGFQIVADLIRHAKDSHTLLKVGHRNQIHKDLIRLIDADQATFNGVRDTIKADNERNHLKPLSSVSRPTSARPLSAQVLKTALPPSSSASRVAAQSSQRFSVPAAPSPGRAVPQGPRPQADSNLERRPDNQPRSSVDAVGNDDGGLAERFARLRSASGRNTAPRPSSLGAQGATQDSNLRRDNPSLHMTAASSASMATDQSHRALRAIDTTGTQAFPKAPSPTYTPIRSMQSPTAIAPPRSTRSAAPLHDQPESVTTNSPASAPVSSGGLLSKHASKRSEDTNSIQTAPNSRRKSLHRPMESEIDARKLFDYLQTYSILLIDVRSREDYDAGHIYATTGICIEPTALRPNMSASELYEALVLSPQEEQDLFDNRERFHLVVYYDQSSTATSRAKGHSPAITYLHEALYDYNQDKPLPYPPILLDGGLDSWIEMMGNQSLKTSNTAHRPRTTKPRSNSKAYAESRIDAQKRRHREYNPLAPEEEQKWRERARSESKVLDLQPQRQVQTSSSESHGSYDVNDFARRYPDISMLGDMSDQPVASEPSQVPSYPQAPKPTQPPSSLRPQQPPPPVPPVPSRPPPAIARPSYGGVTERSSSQQGIPQRAMPLEPYIPSRLKRVPRVGLHNFGATCYMNSAIQCMSATIDLTAVFLDGGYKRDMQPENWKGSKGLMPELYCILLRNLWESTDVDTIRPTNFRKFCARLNKEWGTDRQQDAKEFLDFLLDILHEDLNVNWKHNPLRPLTTAEEARREQMAPFMASKLEWERYLHRDKSKLTELFAGQHISRLQCMTCKHTSTVYETFYSISVEIPQTSKPVTIYDCLKSYCQTERLSGDEVWKCPHCKCEREAYKRITIARVPSFLVVHFKRFSASHSERARKIHTAVDFPLKDFDLEPFVLPAPNGAMKEQMARSYGSQIDTPSCMTPPYRYDAYAMVRHLGQTMASGHYIGLVKDRARGCWREFNDERVTDFRPEELPPNKRLQNEQAYIVFFQRVQAF